MAKMMSRRNPALAAVVVGSLMMSIARATTCPDLKSVRTDFVTDSPNATMMQGLWYEIGYYDIAQSGASCQTFTNTASDDGFEQLFKTAYGPLPFQQTYVYKQDTADLGVYTKYLKGTSWLLQLPTVVVDVEMSADGASYESLTEYTCKQTTPFSVAVELRFSSRVQSTTSDDLERMKAKALAAGIDADTVDRVKAANRSTCT